ncbi:sporulation protein YqfD [Iocasia frigidifontis]|uniref:Sporulation protein YqfD n=1 Tax=Iocasia fonsfrigidae TaxID=2682810 RepID=A0A8A7KGF1_9FIRM|nr:sporulation protein YqfD [Iocasia fonsfrigidae]QTL97967.1 sporulation protein YqfD [Iocasia fonsfrigidae]
MLKYLIRFIKGYLVIDITGNALERFINQMIALDIFIWDLRRIKKSHYRAKIYTVDFSKLRLLVKRRKCRVNIVEKKGLPILFFRTYKRKFLLIGFLIFILLFYAGSSFLWFIEIEGLETIDREDIINILEHNGIKPGIYKRNINPIDLERELLKNESRLIWANVRWQGTCLNIRLVEKKTVSKTAKGNVVAAKNGVINDFIVLKGRGIVSKGDTVTEGQPLILAGEGEERAHGIVRAYVWYTAEALCRYNINEVIFTGENRKFWGIKIADKTFWLKPIKANFNNYKRKREIKTIPKWRNINIPLELIIEEHREINFISEKLSRESAIFLAKEKALYTILSDIPADAVIHSVQSRDISLDDKTVKIKLLVKVEEDIADLPGIDKEGFSVKD